jgi:predicted dehydrogenase
MKVAVVGLGFMGATHIKAWRDVPGAELVAVVSSDASKRAGGLTGIRGNLGEAGAAMDFSGLARYGTLDECLRDPNVEAVDICVPTDLHERLATASLRAGKHVLVEKPMALDGASAERTMAEARRAGRVLMCAQVLRFLPAYRAAREALPSLGRVRSAMFRRRCGAPGWSPWLADRARSGGAVYDLLIHDVDYAVQLFGAPRWVSAFGAVDRGLDWIAAEFRYPGGRTGSALIVAIEGGWYSPSTYPWSAEFTIMAEEGTLDYSSAGTPLRIIGEETKTLEVSGADGFTGELAYFAECASKNRHPDLCPPAESALAVRLVRLMVESRERNGERLACSISE